MLFYAASYGKGDSKGIYIYDINKDTMTLSFKNHIKTPEYPS